MTALRRLALPFALASLAWLPVRGDEPKKDAPPAEASYFRDIRPIFQQHCQGCHQPAKASGGYVMTSHAALLKKTDTDQPGVVPGKPDDSSVVDQIVAKGENRPSMPRDRDPLAEHQVSLIKKWIAQGAKDDTPASARLAAVDAEHPPVYTLPPVITALDYSPDGRLLAVTGYHEVLLHEPDGSGLVARLVGASERVQSLAFSPDGKRLAAVGGNPGRFGEVQIWDVEKRKLTLAVSVTFDTLYGVSWAPDGSKVAFGGADNTLRALDAKDGKQVLFQGAHNDWVTGTAFTRDGNYVISISRDRSVKLTEVATQRFIDNITSITPGALKGGLLTLNLRPLKGNQMSKVPPDTPGAKPLLYDEVLTAGSDGAPRLYKVHREAKRVIGDDFNKVREFEGFPGRVYASCFSPDASLFAAGSSLDGKGEARVYQANDGKRVSVLEGQKGAVYALAWSPDGKAVASAGFDGVVRLNDPLTGKLLKEFSPVPLAERPR